MVQCSTPDRVSGVVGLSLTSVTALCPWTRHKSFPSAFSTQENPFRHNWKNIDYDLKNQIKQNLAHKIVKNAWKMLLNCFIWKVLLSTNNYITISQNYQNTISISIQNWPSSFFCRFSYLSSYVKKNLNGIETTKCLLPYILYIS